MFVFSRIFLGHGIVYAIVSGAALLGELGHPKERAFLGSMFNAFFGVGAVIGAGIVVKTLTIKNDWSWRLPSILQCLPSLLQITFAFTVPESPRWLISKDRGEEALAILIKYHAEGDASNELPHLEYAEIRRALEMENDSRRRGWAELFQSAGMRRRTLLGTMLGMFTQFSGNSRKYSLHIPMQRLTLLGSYFTVPCTNSQQDRHLRQLHPSPIQCRQRSLGIHHWYPDGKYFASLSSAKDILALRL